MKRRKLQKTPGSAAGAAARCACSTPGKATGKEQAVKKHPQTETYGLAPISPPDPDTPFKLSVRRPGWFPDGADLAQGPRQRLSQAEVVGKKAHGKYESFPVNFRDKDDGSKKWVLGSKLIRTEEAPAGQVTLTRFVRRLALRARQYNASLYRLRRLHFYWDYRDKPAHQLKWPPPNPCVKESRPPNPSDGRSFGLMVKDAEEDWCKVANQMDDLLDGAKADTNPYGLKLLAADMITANGYIVSMRVVVQTPGAGKQSLRTMSGLVALREPGGSSSHGSAGSSSHVSLSLTFSSSSPNPYSRVAPDSVWSPTG